MAAMYELGAAEAARRIRAGTLSPSNLLAACLKRIEGLQDALFIAVTGYGRKEDREQSLACGFDHYFVKPLDTALLISILASSRMAVV